MRRETSCLRHQIPSEAIDVVWDAIALHTTPGIPKFKKPEVALVTAGVEMDVLGLGFAEFGDEQRKQIVAAHPRGDHFKEHIIQAFFDGINRSPKLLLATSRRTCSSGWIPTTSGLTFVMSFFSPHGQNDAVHQPSISFEF
jgi:hypothetical protein